MTVAGVVERSLIRKAKHGTLCAALIDPEEFSPKAAADIAAKAARAGVSLILVGGSTLSDQNRLDEVVKAIKHHVTLPVVLFPGNVTGVSKFADAILFSSLLNSTNPYFIVGAQSLGSLQVFKAGIETIPMGYLVFGNSSATSFIGQVNSVPQSKPDLAVMYALAAWYLGMRSLYLEGGSGTAEPIPSETIKLVRRYYGGLLIIGGGITTKEAAAKAAKAGADVVVVGNLLQSPGSETTLRQIVKAIKKA